MITTSTMMQSACADFKQMQCIPADMHSLPGDPRQRLIDIGISCQETEDTVPSLGSHNLGNSPQHTVPATW